jgi:zinc D-Ala-D-Ala carboxypeptidase
MKKTLNLIQKACTSALAIAVVAVSFFSFLVCGTSPKDELLGKFDPATHADFAKIEKTYTGKDNIYMRKQAYEAFKLMHAAAKKEGINISIISATRNFDYQKGIWEKKWKREKYKGWKDLDKVKDIMKYSSMPGTSRHHWGTDVDFNSVEPAYFASGEGKKLYDWLVKNATSFGFGQTYSVKTNGRTGYEEEKWHWSYLPLSKEYLKQYNATVKYEDLTGFSGCAEAKAAQAFELYVNGIDPTCK